MSPHACGPLTEPGRIASESPFARRMQALEIEAGDLVDGALVTNREKLFSKVGVNTVVVTY
jgi:hypothetical protein